MPPEAILSVEALRTDYPGQGCVVDRVSFEVRRGASMVLLGESGSGKSTIALSIMRLLASGGRVRSGHVRFEGVDLLRLEEREMRRIRGRRIGMIFQEPQSALNPVLTVGTQLSECVSGRGRRERMLRLLEAVGLPDPLHALRSYPHQLSGGMRQRVVIAMAIAAEPALLIADEPTSALDVTIQAQILDLIRSEQRRREMAVVLVTHDLGVAHVMGDDITVLYRGVVVEQAARDLLFANPRHPYTRDLLAAVPSWERRFLPLARPSPARPVPLSGCFYADRCLRVREACHQAMPELQSDALGHLVRCLYPHREGEKPEETDFGQFDAGPARVSEGLLAAEDVRVRFEIPGSLFGRKRLVEAVRGVSLRIGRGRTLALVGESGSGKTTLGKAIARLVPLAAGRLYFCGEDLTHLEGETLRRKRREIQMIFQDPYASLDPRMTVGEIIGEGLWAQGIEEDRESRRASVLELFGQVGLPETALDRYPHQFSGGQRQRIAIARALALRPALIICDEPTSALDVSVQAQILHLLRNLQNALGLSYLFITHNLGLVEYLAHDVAILYAGQVVERGPVAEVLKGPRHPYTVSLLDSVPRPDRPVRWGSLGVREYSSGLASRGCAFHPRCPAAMPRCREEAPAPRVYDGSHEVACHLESIPRREPG
ncbi:MAG: dipeptide ABC transporter ATP-binding protein [Acidiferrobacteraceae bacterium]